MSLLSIVSSFAGRNGIPVPSTVIGNTDTNVIQILRLLEEEGNDLAKRGNWNVLTREATHTTVATEDQSNCNDCSHVLSLHLERYDLG